MNKANTEKLMRAFPSLYQTVPYGRFFRLRQWCQEKFARWLKIKTPSIRESLIGFGFECNDGWFDILWRLSKDLSKISRRIKVLQVKEKYGELRYYFGAPSKVDEVADNRIITAELEALRTCEVCGHPGRLCANSGWYKTVCTNLHCNENGAYIPVDEEV